jgi:3,4-dihydroxy 2-butanone 4-phosphate synthase/GTP cyclohydrolase II
LNYQDGQEQHPTLAYNYRDYGIGTQILKNLGINKFKVITQNPNIKPQVGGYDVEVTDWFSYNNEWQKVKFFNNCFIK